MLKEIAYTVAGTLLLAASLVIAPAFSGDKAPAPQKQAAPVHKAPGKWPRAYSRHSMQTLRPILTALLGLTLWVQGFAIAAAPIEVPDEPGAAMEMPCHGDAASAPCDCCDGDCPDMASCVIGHLFAAAPHMPAPATALAHAASATGGWSLKTAVLSLPVRPPIISHA